MMTFLLEAFQAGSLHRRPEYNFEFLDDDNGDD